MSSIIILNIPHASSLLPLEDIPLPFHEPGGIIYLSPWGEKQQQREIYGKDTLKNVST